MIIGYDFWGDFYNYDKNTNVSIITSDNDGVAFDTCNPLKTVNQFTLRGGKFDELHITKDKLDINNNSTEKNENWTISSVLLAKFQNNLIAGTISVYGKDMYKLELRRRRKGDTTFKTYYTIDFDPTINIYTIVDKLIENEADYEYCIRAIALENGAEIHSNDSIPSEIRISYEHAHLFDSTANFDLIYDFKINSMSNQIGANTIETLGSSYPYIIYGQSNYLKGSIECLLVSEESATGMVDVHSEIELRKKVLAFLTNKKSKVLKNEDGTYMLIQIIGTPTLIPTNEIVGIYQVNFEYVQIGNVDDIQDLKGADITFEYFLNNNETQKQERIVG